MAQTAPTTLAAQTAHATYRSTQNTLWGVVQCQVPCQCGHIRGGAMHRSQPQESCGAKGVQGAREGVSGLQPGALASRVSGKNDGMQTGEFTITVHRKLPGCNVMQKGHRRNHRTSPLQPNQNRSHNPTKSDANKLEPRTKPIGKIPATKLTGMLASN